MAADRRAEVIERMRELVDEYFAGRPPEDPTDCPLSVPLYGLEEVMAALDVLLSQNVTMGARVREFEEEFAPFIGSRHAVMVNSGSSANLLALAILSSSVTTKGLHPGDEVIVPAMAWSTTIAPILQAGCVPVFVDVDTQTLNLRPEDLARAWSARTRAIFVVHLLGNPVAMEQVMSFARERDLWVIEDTCESLGSTVDGAARARSATSARSRSTSPTTSPRSRAACWSPTTTGSRASRARCARTGGPAT